MLRNSLIHIQQLSYSLPNGNVLFDRLDLSFSTQKTGIVGKNGVGKSTLLKLIMNDMLPHSGQIAVTGVVAYCPQDYSIYTEKTVADVLGVTEKLSALRRILAGDFNPEDLTILNDDWTLKERLEEELSAFGLSEISLNQSIENLSGGELTRLMLVKTFLTNANFVLLDEPTNNLDITARKLLYDALERWQGGFIVVSHDRALLNLMDEIVELTTLGAKSYGGNYDCYVKQKAAEQAAVEQDLQDAKKSLQKTQQSVQASREKHEQRQSKGRHERRSGKTDKMSANSARGRSEHSQHTMSIKEDRMRQNAEDQLQSAKERIEISREINISLPATSVPNGKMMVEMEDVVFSYAEKPIIQNLNLKIVGPERIGLVGKNGAGKTTLVKLITGELQPTSGRIYLGTNRVSYLEQNAKSLNPNLSVLENFQKYNPEIGDMNSRLFLAQFLFRNVAALKLVKDLSGGEKLRAMLACVLMSKEPPQLLILDEPTNHLDLASIESIETALNCYEGTLIVISHDERFLQAVDVKKVIQM